jgi:rubrerythrin
MDDRLVRLLAAARRAEKEQALFYRALAAEAEAGDRLAESERLNELHADEQHQLSRLTARLLELGAEPEDLQRIEAPAASLDGWEAVAREREAAEVGRYEGLLAGALDAATRAMLVEFLQAEREHARALGGKWMGA